MSSFIKTLSQRLFWDVDPETIDEQRDLAMAEP